MSHRFGGRIAEDVTGFLKTIYRAQGEAIMPLIGAGDNSGRVLTSHARSELISASCNSNTLIITCTNIGIVREAMVVCDELLTAGERKRIALVKGPKLKETSEQVKNLVRLQLGLIPTYKIYGHAFADVGELLE